MVLQVVHQCLWRFLFRKWQKGLYNEGKKMEWAFPFGSKLVVRAKTIGPNSLKSDSVLSEEVMVS